ILGVASLVVAGVAVVKTVGNSIVNRLTFPAKDGLLFGHIGGCGQLGRRMSLAFWMGSYLNFKRLSVAPAHFTQVLLVDLKLHPLVKVVVVGLTVVVYPGIPHLARPTELKGGVQVVALRARPKMGHLEFHPV